MNQKKLKCLKPSNHTPIWNHWLQRFPMNHSVLRNVASITIRGCENCSCLPLFGELPCLELVCRVCWRSGYWCSFWIPYKKKVRRLFIGEFHNLKGLLKKNNSLCLNRWRFFIAICLFLQSFLFIILGLLLPSILAITMKLLRSQKRFSKALQISNTLKSLFYNLKELPSSLACLNALKRLEIHSCSALDSLPEEGMKGLTSLTELFVYDCEMLKFIQHLTALTSLKVRRCPTLAKRCEKGIGEDWHKIAPNLDIGINRTSCRVQVSHSGCVYT